MQNPTRKLRVVEATGLERGNCGTVLMHAEDDQVHGLFIHCIRCGACNATVD